MPHFFSLLGNAAGRLFGGAGAPAGRPDLDALPSKIRAAIARQQDGSERLIGWIQLAILTSFAALYVAAPKTTPTGAAFEPVPAFLGAYFLFTCLRLWRAYKGSLPAWFLVVSIGVDMALLLGLIWSFHLQYEQPPSFYLKAPTLLYLFIFIALRALRFEPGYVLLAGLVGAAGWLALVGFAVMGEAGGAMVTRDYVVYLTSNSVLVGGEVDKVMSIMVVTAVLCVAIARARRLLIQSIFDSSAKEDLSHFVPEGVASRIATAEGKLPTENREATMLFADVENFTSMSEGLSSDETVQTMNEYFALFSAAVEDHNGVVIFFQGDAIFAAFNLPADNPEHATCAVAAAIEVQRLLARHTFSIGKPLRARIGINTGVVTGGVIGAQKLSSYTLYGDAVNIAARLEQLNKKHGTNILASARTVELCDPQQFKFESKGFDTVRGRTQSIEIFTPRITTQPATENSPTK
ncbi:MAG: adenylate/guanylate cyclase domain-containing protein [Gammaproteobacteria bacterium]|nr:adenylate/guanylate cyclase domain-containing protein [Gammaproteobacteria bacterium]